MNKQEVKAICSTALWSKVVLRSGKDERSKPRDLLYILRVKDQSDQLDPASIGCQDRADSPADRGIKVHLKSG